MAALHSRRFFDNEDSYSIGFVTLDPKNPATVWVGSGENNSQRSVSWGDGVYRSDDDGRTWRNLGLKKSEHIARILIDPRDSNVVYVASQGPLWGPGGERGVLQNDGWRKNLEEYFDDQRKHRRDGLDFRAGKSGCDLRCGLSTAAARLDID